jgi:hypothetical protein
MIDELGLYDVCAVLLVLGVGVLWMMDLLWRPRDAPAPPEVLPGSGPEDPPVPQEGSLP